MYKCAVTIIYWFLIQPIFCIFVLASEIPNSVIAADFDDPVPAGEIRAMRFVDATRAWAVRITNTGGLEVLRSKDGAKTWQNCDPGGDWLSASQNAVAHTKETKRPDALMLDLFAQDSKTAWVAIAAKHDGKTAAFVAGTHDGGLHWSEHWAEIGNDVEVLNLQFVDQKNGFLLGRSRPATNELAKRLYRTADGGVSWTEIILPDSHDREEWTGCIFRTPLDGWFMAESLSENEAGLEAIFTNNGGKSWNAKAFEVPNDLKNGQHGGRLPQFFGENKKYGIMGVYHLTQDNPEKDVMLFYQTHDGGDHWKQAGKPPVETWGKNLDYYFLEDGTGWLVVEKRIFITKDRAKTWNEIKTSVPLWEDEQEGDVFQLKFINHKMGWIFVPFERNKLLQTLDGGQTWKQIF